MKASELRIGNYVWDNYSGEMIVAEIGESYLGLRKTKDLPIGRYGTAKPIVLTEKWLVEFGFNVRESSTCKLWYIGKNNITHDWLFDLVWLEKPELINAPNAPFYRNGRHTVYYVHQLQNLYFALTGEELQLTTNKQQ